MAETITKSPHPIPTQITVLPSLSLILYLLKMLATTFVNVSLLQYTS